MYIVMLLQHSNNISNVYSVVHIMPVYGRFLSAVYIVSMTCSDTLSANYLLVCGILACSAAGGVFCSTLNKRKTINCLLYFQDFSLKVQSAIEIFIYY